MVVSSNKIIHGNCLDEMRKMEDNSISCIVTDPPYGLHFMGKDWDHGIPGEVYWKEAYRIAKPGSFLLSFGGTRTYHRLTCVIEDAGFEIRDCLMWIFGSGFPKSHNHFGLEGYGTALKPAYEPIIMAMKPCDGTFKQNVEKWGQGGINIDECRIGEECRFNPPTHKSKTNALGSFENCHGTGTNVKGRWPANILFDEEAANMLDDQSGVLKSGEPGSRKKEWSGYQTGLKKLEKESGFGDSGGASRFFYCPKTSSRERNEGLEGLEYKKGERWPQSLDGNDERYAKPKQNNHPTVKPLKLMEYLIKLVMPPKDGILLDPFAGSGTTILAAKRLGFNAIGIEKCEEYAKIAAARVDNYIQQMDLF